MTSWQLRIGDLAIHHMKGREREMYILSLHETKLFVTLFSCQFSCLIQEVWK
uniref:Uncharacterized protein n=1 Tax=Rhizophora mucronata TaxID=61149 RepID=A0A2P2IUB9_RHIMU